MILIRLFRLKLAKPITHSFESLLTLCHTKGSRSELTKGENHGHE